MKIMYHSTQRGSATAFLVIGIILTISLIGSVYVLNQHGEQVRKEQAIAEYDKQQIANKKTDTPSDTATNSNGTKEATQVASTQELPTTGPGSIVDELLGAGLLSAFAIGFLLSRRELAHTL